MKKFTFIFLGVFFFTSPSYSGELLTPDYLRISKFCDAANITEEECSSITTITVNYMTELNTIKEANKPEIFGADLTTANQMKVDRVCKTGGLPSEICNGLTAKIENIVEERLFSAKLVI